MNDFDETLRDRLATLAQEAVPDADAHVDADLANVEWIEPRRHTRGRVTRALLVAAAVLVVVGLIATVVAVRRGDNSPDVAGVTVPTVTATTVTATTVTATTVTATTTPTLEPADAQTPAAGACAVAQNNVGTVALGSPDNVPQPRCLILYGNQQLRVMNSAGTPVTVSMGYHFHATIAPHGEYLFTDAVAQYLAPGVHRLSPAGLPGAEIWVDPPCSQTVQGCATP